MDKEARDQALLNFKVGFITALIEASVPDELQVKVAEKALSMDQMEKAANPLTAAIGGLWSGLKTIGPAALASVPALGFGAGAAGGYMSHDVAEEDVEAYKKRELIGELRRLTQQAQQNILAKQYRDQMDQARNVRSILR